MHLYLRPCEIFYSQSSISNTFKDTSKHSGILIGSTLDALVEGRIDVEDIPTIQVVRKDYKWFALDNRRLWLFRRLGRMRMLDSIRVNVKTLDAVSFTKFSTFCGGIQIAVRGDVGSEHLQTFEIEERRRRRTIVRRHMFPRYSSPPEIRLVDDQVSCPNQTDLRKHVLLNNFHQRQRVPALRNSFDYQHKRTMDDIREECDRDHLRRQRRSDDNDFTLDIRVTRDEKERRTVFCRSSKRYDDDIPMNRNNTDFSLDNDWLNERRVEFLDEGVQTQRRSKRRRRR